MFKSKQEIIVIQAEATDPITTGVVFWSHDKGTAKLLFQLKKDTVNQTLAEGTIVPICLVFNGGRHIYHAVIEDALNGIVSIVLEDNILGYQGRVDGSIYIELPDSRSLDTAGRFTFDIKRSPIDENVPELEDYYWQGFNEIMTQYHQTIATIKLEAKALLDSLTADVTKVKNDIATANVKIAEIRKKLDDNDVFTKAESSANVIYQIGGTESTIVPEKLLVDGNAGVAARNVNGTIRPFSQTDYDNLNSNIVIGTETATNGNAAQFEFNFDVVDYIESIYPSIFLGLTSITDKLNKLKTVLKSVKIPHLARGATSSKFDWWNYQANNWEGVNFANTSAGFVEKTYEINTINDVTFSRLFGNTGVFKSRIYSGLVSDGTQKSWLELKDFSLVIEVELSAKDIIDYTIAANSVGLSGDQTVNGIKTFVERPLIGNKPVALKSETMDLSSPQSADGLKNFIGGLQLSGINAGTEYAKAVDTDKYTRHGAVYLGSNLWLAWETLTFQNASGYAKGSYISVGSDNNAAFTYPDVKNPVGGYIWIGGACQPDFTDGGFGSHHITVENNFDDARKPIVRFLDSPTTLVKKLAVRGVALVFAPPPTSNSKI